MDYIYFYKKCIDIILLFNFVLIRLGIQLIRKGWGI